MEGGRVYLDEKPRTFMDFKLKVQACVVYDDYATLANVRRWLLKIHGSRVNKIIDDWINQVPVESICRHNGNCVNTY